VSGATKLELGSPSPSRQALLQQQQQLALLGSVLYDRETIGRQAGTSREGLIWYSYIYVYCTYVTYCEFHGPRIPRSTGLRCLLFPTYLSM
jgi:hypothetical protein